MSFLSPRPHISSVVLDALEDAVLAFSERRDTVFLNAAARTLIANSLPDTLDSLREEALHWRTRFLEQPRAAEGLVEPREDNILIENIAGRRERLYRLYTVEQHGNDTIVVVIMRRYPAARELLSERDRAVEELEQSHRASLNIMEDLVRQKDQLESANHALEEEIQIRKRTEEARDRIAAIVESSEDAIYSCSLQGVVTSWNKGAERLFDYTTREILGRDSGCLSPENEQVSMRELHKKIARGERVVSFECKRLTRSGKIIDVATTSSPLFDLRGRMAGYSVISRDISKRIATELELAQYREHLEKLVAERTHELALTQEKAHHAERLASIGALAAGIAHEINNPIGAMLLAAQNALEFRKEATTVDEMSEMLDRLGNKVVANSERCGLIVRGVLQFAKKQRTEKWLNDINLIVRNSIQLVRESMNVSFATITTDFASQLPTLLVNPVEIEQVVVNLVKNACQSGEGAVVVKVSTRALPKGIRIVVEDNGKGIGEQELAHIFDPFFTTRLERGGTGLGLSIVHGIVTGYGGTIDVQSSAQKGTAITIDFPLMNPNEGVSDSMVQHSSLDSVNGSLSKNQ